MGLSSNNNDSSIKQKGQTIVVNDFEDDIEKIEKCFVQKNKKSAKKFSIYYGSGKTRAQTEFEADSQEERDAWVKAVQLMIMFHYRRESENGNLNADSARMSIARKAD